MRRAAVTFVAFALVLGVTGPARTDNATESPVASVLEEQVESRLVQIDVQVDGDPEAVDSLTADDFSLTVGGRKLEGFSADRLCDDQTAEGSDDDGSSRSFVFFVVERWVEDGLANEFAPITITETDDPCVQTVDVVRAERFRPGVVDYRVTARIGDEVVAQERRALRVGSTTEPR